MCKRTQMCFTMFEQRIILWLCMHTTIATHFCATFRLSSDVSNLIYNASKGKIKMLKVRKLRLRYFSRYSRSVNCSRETSWRINELYRILGRYSINSRRMVVIASGRVWNLIKKYAETRVPPPCCFSLCFCSYRRTQSSHQIG